MNKITSDSSLYRVIDKVVPGNMDELLEKINGGDSLNIKFGTDPTGTDMHFGHAVNLWALKGLQDMGHKVDLIIGDATAQIGDPTGRNKERPEMTNDEIENNSGKFLAQVGTVLSLDDSVFTLRHNADWYKNMDALEFISKLLKPVTLSKLIERNTFKDRINNNVPIHSHELVYQLLQGYDSVHLNSDIAFCGDDQLTNEIMGRTLQGIHGQTAQSIVTTKITPGIDGGLKQSKSVGNYIGLNQTSSEQFRRIMSIPDNLIKEYFYIYTDLSTPEIESLVTQFSDNLRELKMILASHMLSRYHDTDIIESAKGDYLKSSKNLAPSDINVSYQSRENFDILEFASSSLSISKRKFRELVVGGAIYINGSKLGAENISPEKKILFDVTDEFILKYGRNKWIKIILK